MSPIKPQLIAMYCLKYNLFLKKHNYKRFTNIGETPSTSVVIEPVTFARAIVIKIYPGNSTMSGSKAYKILFF